MLRPPSAQKHAPKYLKCRVHEWLAAISCISNRQSACAVLTVGSHSSLPELSNIRLRLLEEGNTGEARVRRLACDCF